MSTSFDWRPLIEAARKVREQSYAPYSRFRVGAALLADDGTIVTGANVENRSYGLAICAERSAIARAVARGHRRFQALVVVADLDPPAPPCGMCRETLAEFAANNSAPDLPILLVNLEGKQRRTSLDALFPDRFAWSGPG